MVDKIVIHAVRILDSGEDILNLLRNGFWRHLGDFFFREFAEVFDVVLGGTVEAVFNAGFEPIPGFVDVVGFNLVVDGDRKAEFASHFFTSSAHLSSFILQCLGLVFLEHSRQIG